MEELTENAEDTAEEGEKAPEIKLGRLKYKVNQRTFSGILSLMGFSISPFTRLTPVASFQLEYDFNANNLSVTVIQAEDLPALDMGGTSGNISGTLAQ